MKLHELKKPPGSTKAPKRKGRGTATGQGKTAGRGQDGQKSRSGGGVRLGFEGGQMPLYRRIPKRGFTNIWRKEFEVVNLKDLNVFDEGAVVDAAALKERGLVKGNKDGVKILAKGELEKKLTVRATAFSGTAKEKIESLGGAAEVN
ncbi:MAG: 50S ribosomal protein L15 [Clostridiales Family XIII bacterium]|jgi:large subunit ribosomal protein L15|nr:50S ribosomal protein L15 [Clostridiales Family XIII bacterium]